MRPPSSRMRPSTVTITPVSFGDDDDGGRPPRNGTPSAPFSCRVHDGAADDATQAGREQGVLSFVLHLFEDPGDVRVRDVVAWLDFSPPRALVVVGAPRSAAGDRSTWLVDCEYRPPLVPRT